MSDPRAKLPILDDSGDCHAEWKRPPAAAAELDLAAVRARLAERRGPEYWRSLEEVAASPAFDEMLHREFPRFAAEWPSDVSRRNFLQLAAASLGLAGLTACTRQPLERIVPYVRQPEEVVPGVPLHFATAISISGVSEPVLAESHEGRPTKLEGNPDHPAATGASTAIVQAAVLGLYDPDRSQAVTDLGRISSWPGLQRALGAALAKVGEREGAGLRLLTGPTSSPTEAALVAEILGSYPRARWHRWDPLARDEADAGARLAFGRPVATRYRVELADVVVALEADFLAAGPGSVSHAAEFAARRRPTPERPEMNRLYAAESSPTPTGTMADHRLALAPSRFGALVVALAAEVGVPGAAAPAGLDEPARRWARAAARDLAAHRGRSLVVAGDTLPAAAHALVHAINDVLGSFGETLLVSEPLLADPVPAVDSLAELARDLREGRVEVLVVSGVNPAYDAPADLDFASALNREGVLRFHHGLYADETAELCHWHLPAAHDLEAWGDGRAGDGTVTLRQPLIEPLYGGRSLAELLAVVAGRGETPGYELLRERWQELPDEAFRQALHDGYVAGSGLEPVAAAPGNVAAALVELAAPAAPAGVELALRPDPALLDGRFANNGWLQELPKPITKLTWDNALLVSPRTAERLGLANEQVVAIEVGGRRLSAPAWILPGQADEVATLHLGYGRRRGGRVADGVGVDAFALQTSTARWNQTGANLVPTGRRHELACTQGHYMIDSWLAEESEEAERRHVVRGATLDEFKADPAFVTGFDHAGLDTGASFAPGYAYDGAAWAMTIDLSSCNGCNACVVACQAENNIPVVGKEQVRSGRELHWIRVDRYFQGGIDAPEAIVSQPIPCMQCEQAPCETVCPVAATVHSSEGLNDMVYNRCVGTRYCSNNCPYKVRRFNFLLYADWDTPQLQLGRNPNVTVRSRGVMEKCTYCTQRISRARIGAEREGRKLRDGEIVTACQQACPTHAIVFGDQNDADSAVARAKRDPRNYALLAELGTRPRTTYLALVRNPNPELAG
ncbi:MAG TPA: TAT-variant-translocated molybdopterin oxidoreductase [Thermoanaerobaculia bacterium]